MPTVQVDDIRLYYEVHGTKGPLFVFSHAYPMNRTIWAPQVDRFARDHRVVTYDCRGFGRSDAPEGADAYSQDRSVDDLLAVIDGVGGGPAIVCGLSMGGNIALHLGLNHPERVRALVIADTGAGSDDPEGFRAEVERWADLALTKGLEAFAEAIMANPIFSEYAARGPAARRLMWEAITGNTPRGVALTARRVLARRPPVYALESRLRDVRVPALIVVGEHDTACIRPGEFLASTMPRARLEIISGAGHFGNLEEADRFNALVETFLGGLGG